MNADFMLPESFVLFDLEYTAWPNSQIENWTKRGEYREIIQFGAIRVEGKELTEKNSLLLYVKPEKNPILSEFIIGLTGITQEKIESEGITFPSALKKFQAFIADTITFCWGRDIEVLGENCTLHQTRSLIRPGQLTDLRPLMQAIFWQRGIDVNKYSSGTLVHAFDIEAALAPHNALNDTRNLLQAFRLLRERGNGVY